MLETSDSLLPQSDKGRIQVVTVGFDEESLDELQRLLDTLGADISTRVLASQQRITPSTYIGKGKVEEVQQAVEEFKADGVIVDVELSPNQLKNLENEIKKPVLDRPGVIIEIFSRHARTKESKTQVELARLQYLLPRLAHMWTHFERQRGGIGQKGMGESQIEVDRRLVKTRMSLLRLRLKDIEKERKVQRSGRRELLKVAIVGYTNAGKSTLLNALTHSKVLAEDKLFATLDASIRLLNPDSRPPMVLVDTVGFISNLPHSLVASFRSTLEEVNEADLLVHVVDGSSTHARDQFEVTETVLKELGAEKKNRIVVVNKTDLVSSPLEKNKLKLISPGAVQVSAFSKQDMDRLRKMIVEHFQKSFPVFEVLIPYADSKLEAQIRVHGQIEVLRHLEKGTFLKVRMEEGWAKKLNLGRYLL